MCRCLLPGVALVCAYLLTGGVVQPINAHTIPEEALCNRTGLEYLTHEKNLISCLMHDYDPSVRPALGPDTPVNVSFNSVIFTITALNEKTGVLTTDSWLRQTWVDIQLRWRPEDFGNLKEIRLPVEKIWTPQIVLINNADESFRYVMDKLVVVNSSGHVTWVPHARLHSFCRLDMTLFPYDTQQCKLYLGSWSYEASLVSISIPEHNRFLPDSADWDVLDFRVETAPFHDGLKVFPTIMYTIRMKRLTVFYSYVIVTPSIIIACLIVMLFWIPPESKERLMLATGILVSLSVLLLLLEEYLPSDRGSLPIIASYVGFNFVLLVLTIAISIVTMNCRYRGIRNGTVPSWIRWLFLGRLSKLVCVKVTPYTKSSPLSMDFVTEEQEARRELHDILPDPQHSDISPLPRSPTMAIEKTMDEIRKYLRYMAAKSDVLGQPVAPHSELVLNEWHQLALVIDRLVFWVFVFITFVTTLVLFCPS